MMPRPPLAPTVILGEAFQAALEASREVDRRLRALQRAAEPLASQDQVSFLEIKRLEAESAASEFLMAARRLLAERPPLPRDYGRSDRILLYLYNRRGLLPLITEFTAPRELFTDTIAGALLILRGNTYSALERLRRLGLVERVERRIPQPDGPRRAAWRLTGRGLQEAEKLSREASNRGFDPTRV